MADQVGGSKAASCRETAMPEGSEASAKSGLGYGLRTTACPKPPLRLGRKSFDEVHLLDKSLEAWPNYQVALGSAQASIVYGP